MCGTKANHPKVQGNLKFLYVKTFELPEPLLGGLQKKTCRFLSFNKISFSKIFQETESHDVANVYKGHIENFLVGIGSLLLVSCLSNLSHKKRSAGTAWLIR